MKEVVIKYYPDGRIELEGVGFVGPECLRASKPFEKALGLTDIDREYKPEFKEEKARAGNRTKVQR